MNVVSLFDGLSGAMLALVGAGITVNKYYSSEVDPHAEKVSLTHFPEIVRMGDVTKWRDWDIDWSSIDLLTAGSPCQGSSMAGNQAGTMAIIDGEKVVITSREMYLYAKEKSAEFLSQSHLFWEFVLCLDHAKSCNPELKFMLENVKMKKEFLNMITEAIGVEPVFINSALVSAQNRQRHYWANWEITQPRDRGIVLADIIEMDPTSPTIMTKRFCERNQSILRDDVSGKAKTLSAMEYVKNGRQGDYIKCGALRGRYIVDGKRADNTVDSMAGRTKQRLEIRSDNKTNCLTTVQKDNQVVFPDMQYRKLTPIECERLQGIPDGYTSGVSNTQRYKMLGNGWQIDTIVHIFECLIIELFNAIFEKKVA